MSLPRPDRSKPKRKTPNQVTRNAWPGLRKDDLSELKQKIQDKFQWSHSPRPFQLEAIEAQLLRRDVLIHASTGSGKTAVAAGPHVHEKTAGMVTFMVSPLIALQEEQVHTFQQEFNLTATAINSAYGGCTNEIMTKICKGTWQMVIVSPEMMLSKRFIKNVIRSREIAKRILSVVVDEAHVVSHWGSGFRKKYGTLGILRALLPKGTPVVAMSATLSDRVRQDVLNKLQFNRKTYLDLNIGNDRPNVSLVVRAIQNPMNTYTDLDFLIPASGTVDSDPMNVKKTFIYADSVSTGIDMEDHLYSRAPVSWREAGIIRPYSAAFSSEYRKNVMKLFKAGQVRILICTDAAGMGCNIPDIDIVVQWKLPSSVSTFVQRAGRAARGEGKTGLAVLLVEKSVYEADLLSSNDRANESVRSRKNFVRQSITYPKAPKGYAECHGALRGLYGGQSDQSSAVDVPMDCSSPDEGLYNFVQSCMCRREFLTRLYQNCRAVPTVPCCDVCDPTLFNLTRPPPPDKTTRKAGLKIGIPCIMVKEALLTWRASVWLRDFEFAQFGPTAILRNQTIDVLSAVGPITSLIELERLLDGWVWFGKYGNELLDTIKALPVPAFQPKPKESKGTKRTQQNSNGEASVTREGKGKKARHETHGTFETAATPSTTVVGDVTSFPMSVSEVQVVPLTPRHHPGHSHYTYLHSTPQYLPYQNYYLSSFNTPGMQPYTPYHYSYNINTPSTNIQLPSSDPIVDVPTQNPFVYKFHHYNPASSSR